LTRVENQRETVAAQLAQLYHTATDSFVIGFTGPPGSGKSALVTAYARSLREVNLKVAIVAVDPTSPFTGGAILGDRIRMRELAGDEGIFIRSMASRGQLGGLAWRTRDIVRVLAAAGFERVIVETVGAGQSEVEVARLAHTTIVVQAPGAGDGVQAIKAGILEAADILVVNKSDLPGADRVVRRLRAVLEMGHPTKSAIDDEALWMPPVIAASALVGTGIDDLAGAIDRHRCHLRAHGLLLAQRQTQLRAEIVERLRESAFRRVIDSISDEEFAGIIADATQQRIEPQQAVDRFLDSFVIRRRRD
jgi:LAO/AO transport system kinase